MLIRERFAHQIGRGFPGIQVVRHGGSADLDVRIATSHAEK
jgi:hypothetical protein